MDRADIEDRLSGIEKRLSQIESSISGLKPEPQAKSSSQSARQVQPQSQSSSVASSSQDLSQKNISSATSEVKVPTQPVDDSQLFQNFYSSHKHKSEPSYFKEANWLGVVAAICFILAGCFIVKLSLDSGWLTPERQMGLAALLGLSLIGVGLYLRKFDWGYSSLLPAAGIIILFLTTYAGYGFYSLFNFNLALILTSLISGLCIWLYTQVRHDIYAIVSAIGAYGSPFILGTDINPLEESHFYLLSYYYICCSLAFSVISIFVQSRLLTLVASYLAIILTGIAGGISGQYAALSALLLGLHFCIFALGTFFHSRKTELPLTETEAWCFFPVLLIFYAAEYNFIYQIEPNIAPWVTLGFAGFLMVLYLLAKRWMVQGGVHSEGVVFAFISVAVFHSGYLVLMPEGFRPWLLVFILIGVLFYFSKEMTSVLSKKALLALQICFGFIGIIEYLKMISYLLDKSDRNVFLAAITTFGVLWTIFATKPRLTKNESNKEFGVALLAATHILAIVGFYDFAREYGSLAVSMCWLLYALAVILFSYNRKDEVMAKSALLVLGLAAGKALLYDAASAPTIVRILCLISTGVVLYGSGFFLRKISKWT